MGAFISNTETEEQIEQGSVRFIEAWDAYESRRVKKLQKGGSNFQGSMCTTLAKTTQLVKVRLCHILTIVLV